MYCTPTLRLYILTKNKSDLFASELIIHYNDAHFCDRWSLQFACVNEFKEYRTDSRTCNFQKPFVPYSTPTTKLKVISLCKSKLYLGSDQKWWRGGVVELSSNFKPATPMRKPGITRNPNNLTRLSYSVSSADLFFSLITVIIII